MTDDGLTYPAEAMRQACAEAARLRAENDRLRAKVAAVEALANDWDRDYEPCGETLLAALAADDEVHDA